MAVNKRVWMTRLGVVISLVALYLFLKELDFVQMWQALKKANYVWLIPAVLAACGSLLTRAFRWRVFLGVEHRRIRIGRLFNTLTIGFFGNAVLPARAGEFVRSFMLARSEPVKFTEAFATVVVERVFDMFALIVSMVLVFVLAPFPEEVVKANPEIFERMQNVGWLIAIASFSIAAFLFAMVRMPDRCHWILLKLTGWLPDKIQQHLVGALESFVSGLNIFKDLRATIKALCWTAAVWLCILLSEYYTVLAFGFDLSFLDILALMVVLAFAVAAPQGPGYIGVFQFAILKTMVNLFNAPSAPAGAFAIVLWVVQQMPIIVLGFICLHLEGFTISQLWKSARKGESAAEEAVKGEDVEK